MKRKLEDEFDSQSLTKDSKQAKIMITDSEGTQLVAENMSTLNTELSEDGGIMNYLKIMRQESTKQFETLKTEIESSRNVTKLEIEELRKDLLRYDVDLQTLESRVSKLENANNSESIDSIITQKMSSYEESQKVLLKKLQRYQLIYEKQNWNLRKNKILIKGKNFSANNLLSEVNSFLHHYFEQEAAAVDSEIISRSLSIPTIRVTLKSWKVIQIILGEKRVSSREM